MKAFIPLRFRLASRRAQHLMFLAHVWACAPFLVLWLMDMRVRHALGNEAVTSMQPVIVLTLVYLVVRTWLAYRDPKWLQWEYVFPPVDIVIVSAFLYLSHRGPMSNISLLYFLPMVSAAGSLNVRWAAAVGVMVVVGTAVSTFSATDMDPVQTSLTWRELLQAEPLNASFRIYFLIVLSSLMAFQAAIAAGWKERLAVAADRNRIALDMHDGVQGHLIALAQQLELLGHVAERNPARAAELAREGRETTRQAADELRFLVQRLRAPALEDGFVPALRQYAHNVCSRHGLRLEVEVEGSEETLDPDVENALFRIAQEALNNVVKHAGAELVTLTICYGPDEVRLTVRDDGQGFVPTVAEGVGMEGMRSRAGDVGGKTAIESAVGAGTTVKTVVPART
ncbi:MAG: sensor histidine kinase [Fimbriimonas sp.]